MIKTIKYKRINTKIINEENTIQEFFDDLVSNGLEIIYYNEQTQKDDIINITVVVCKKQENTL